MPQLKTQNNNHNNINVFLNANFNLAMVLIVLIFLSLAYFLIIKPKFEVTLVAIRDNIAQQEEFYRGQKQKLINLQAAAVLYNKIATADVIKLNTLLPSEYAKEKLFGELEDILTRQGLIVDNISLNKSGEDNESGAEPLAAKDDRLLAIANSENIGIIQAELSLSAIDYAALKNLLPLLENHLQLIDVRSLNFSPADKTAEIIFDTYYFK
jgi:hypothetical protein